MSWSKDSTYLTLLAQLVQGRIVDLQRLIMSDESFRSLCEDHELVLNTLRQLKSRARTEDAKLISEYGSLVEDLERELLEAFERKRN